VELLHQGAGSPPAATTRLTSDELTPEEETEAVTWLGRWVPNAAVAVAEAESRLATDRLTLRAGLLADMGQYDAVADEYRAAVRAVRTDGPALLVLARLLHQRGQHAAAMLAVDYLQDVTATPNARELPRLLQKVLRPLPYLDLVQAAAAQQKVDPALLYALMRQESLFDPRAFSSAQARGLTQVIPATGEEIAANLGVQGFQQSDLFRPVVSIRFGAHYLARQLAFLGGQPVFALAAYNGGPGSALRWMASNRQMDPDLFVENIDYDETRLYVHKVMENYAFYRLLYGQ
jgi:soluble lytic murein transglycosylase